MCALASFMICMLLIQFSQKNSFMVRYVESHLRHAHQRRQRQQGQVPQVGAL